jgi:hypothetical protein
MALASFNHIPILFPEDPPTQDVTWGFFTFGQRLTTEYSEDDAYQSDAEFSIVGTFTIDTEDNNTENYIVNDAVAAPTDALIALVDRYTALENLFIAAAHAEIPEDPADWFGPNDPRCIALPSPICDASGQPIYALPNRIGLAESILPHSLTYTAILKEGRPPESVALINGHVVQDAKIRITPPKPILSKHRLISGEGAVMNCINYTSTTVSVQGVLPHLPGEAMSGRALALSQSLMTGTMKIELTRWSSTGTVTETLFENLYVENPTIQLRPVELGTAVSVQGKQ